MQAAGEKTRGRPDNKLEGPGDRPKSAEEIAQTARDHDE